ncbi:MAG TPA: hypothetical protein VHA14_01480 [Bryobacteraceae bacterium]|nr:hypothetical protein [Bryobacteraceae bacterium]
MTNDEIVSQEMLAQYFDNGQLIAGATSTTDSFVQLNLNEGGWEGAAKFIASGTPGSDIVSSYNVRLTDLSMTCLNANGCNSGLFHFSDDVVFSQAINFFDQSYSVSIDGSGGDSFVFLSVKNTANDLDVIHQVNAVVNAGTYNFQTSGLIGNVGATDNVTGPVEMLITGSFSISPGEFNQTYSLPDSFSLTLNAATTSPAPEPATWGLAGGLLLGGVAVFLRRRRVQSPRS